MDLNDKIEKILEKVQKALVEYGTTGMSVMEMSHRVPAALRILLSGHL